VFDQDLARVERPKDIHEWLGALLYRPEYPAGLEKVLRRDAA
jgi:hypothetical protein